MRNQTGSNLEPIEDSDLDLKKKFIGKTEVSQEDDENKLKTKEETAPYVKEIPKMKEEQSENETAYSKILAKAKTQKQTTSNDDEDIKDDARIVNLETDAKSKIAKLVNLAQTKGIPYAVKIARHMENYYVLDEFHDQMLGKELHRALIEKGLIKEI